MATEALADLPTIDRKRAPIVRQLSHTAVRTHQMDKIRWFYEDFLGLTMQTTLVARENPDTGEPMNFVHCFFHMADGSSVAFFQFEDGLRPQAFPRPSDVFERHMALRVDARDEVEEFRVRAEQFGINYFVVDHDDFYSIYFSDPDGEQIEITWHKPSFQTSLDPEAASQALTDWLATYVPTAPAEQVSQP